MHNDSFAALFARATGGNVPMEYQDSVAVDKPDLIDVPTGLGKTAAAILSWVWRRRFADEVIRARTPRRLVYSLPMRVLVEQTCVEAIKWLDRLGMLAGEAQWTETDDGLPNNRAELRHKREDNARGYRADPAAQLQQGWSSQHGDVGKYAIAVHLLMGGEEKSDWALWPERDAILIGTQDMLISRALNRGYASGRARWPLEFAFLNSDCLWVFDEIQIMDTSLATSLQLDAWRRAMHLRPARGDFRTQLCPLPPQHQCQSMWMSATTSKYWFERAIDWGPYAESAWNDRLQLTDNEKSDDSLRSGQLFAIQKELANTDITLEKPKRKDGRAIKLDAQSKQRDYIGRVARHITETTTNSTLGLTLIIMNTVDRATQLYKLLDAESQLKDVPITLIHSRFRHYEREQWSGFLSQKDDARRILISTQVVEAGVDLSSAILYTELAPWASLVQRFGRCARYPRESGKVFWLNLDLGTDNQPNEHWAKPYGRSELVAARKTLNSKSLNDVGLKSLDAIKIEVESDATGEQAARLFPYEPRFVPREKDLFDLFDTTPDLTGADVDVSRYIRDGIELDVQVFWREIEDEPHNKIHPDRRELCSVPFHRFRDFAKDALKQRNQIWRRVYAKGRNRASSWDSLNYSSADESVYPGQVFLLEKSCGGYSPELGWTGRSTDTDFDLPEPGITSQSKAQDEGDDDEDLSIQQWQSIEQHALEVCHKLEKLIRDTELTESEINVLRLAARWHDRGKAHPAFTAKIKADKLANPKVQNQIVGEPPAKAPDGSWRRDKPKRQARDVAEAQKDRRRPGHRHELASALAILESLFRGQPSNPAFQWDDALAEEFNRALPEPEHAFADDPLVEELAELCPDEFDLLLYLVAAHHGKVRMSMRSSPDDSRDDVPDPCPVDSRQARGVRDGDNLPKCRIPASDLGADGLVAPEVTLVLDPMELGLSARYGASWRERMQLLLERLGPFRLAYLEGLLRAADCRASKGDAHEEED